jgi:hypothetical protein
MIYVGIDPGLTGAIATMNGSGDVLAIMMPVIDIGKKNVIDVKSVAKHLSGFEDNNVFVTIEKQIPIPGPREKVLQLNPGIEGILDSWREGQGISEDERKFLSKYLHDTKPKEVSVGRGIASTAYFQQQYGELIGLCTGLGIPFITVAPVTWKAEILKGLSWKGNKKMSIVYVQQKYPMVDLLPSPRHRKPSDGKADAICLAEYGKRDKEF